VQQQEQLKQQVQELARQVPQQQVRREREPRGLAQQERRREQPWQVRRVLHLQELASDPQPRERFAACGLREAQSWTMVP
jgi:hypothetical protein